MHDRLIFSSWFSSLHKYHVIVINTIILCLIRRVSFPLAMLKLKNNQMNHHLFCYIALLLKCNLAVSFALAFSKSTGLLMRSSTSCSASTFSATNNEESLTKDEMFQEFASFLQSKQKEIVSLLEEAEGGKSKFSTDKWGFFLSNDEAQDKSLASSRSGGIVRVIQNGCIIEKGAVSLTIIENSILSSERAKTISSRSGEDVREGDVYSAAALSIVLHTLSPIVPTFRSDVRIFFVRQRQRNPQDNSSDAIAEDKKQRQDGIAWFGGGSDLTPYYLYDEDIRSFHQTLREVCDKHFENEGKTYREMKQMCDEYFYLPARKEHRGTGGIFFDDLMATYQTLNFTKDVANSWMPSWLDTIVRKRRFVPYTERQRQWQLLRRGRYLEFNLLYDRGVRFGLAGDKPRIENVMVSAPPMIAFTYNHKVESGSEEEKLVNVLKQPRDWLAAKAL